MDAAPTLFLSLAFLLWCCINFLKRSFSKLPPGPFPYPLFGNIFQLKGTFHEGLGKLSQVYGPLMAIKQGWKTIIVVSSPEVAKEILQKYDHTYTRMLVPDAGKAIDFHIRSVAWMPALNQWRIIRRLCKEQIFSSERLNASQGLRQEKVQQLCDYLHECSINRKAVDIAEAAFTTSLNFISYTLFSVDFAGYNTNSSQEIKGIISGLIKILGATNVADFFPILGKMDLQGIQRKTKSFHGRFLEAFDDIIHQRLQERAKPSSYVRRNDLLETLIDLTEQNEWSFENLKDLVVDLFGAGTETTAGTVEWAMTELLRNPVKKEKAKRELREVIGQSNSVQESDISRLPYLQAVIKETLRLHPPGTYLGRQPEDDIEINQYVVPKDAQIVINIWAIGRDPSLWPDPHSFVPERFLNKDIDGKGQHFELLPFGTGKRICLGIALAHRMLHLIVGSMLHNLDWELEEGIKPEEIDMSEKIGLLVQKKIPLRAIPCVS